MTVVRAPDRGVLLCGLLAAVSAFIVSSFSFKFQIFTLPRVPKRLFVRFTFFCQVGILIGVFGVGGGPTEPPHNKPDR